MTYDCIYTSRAGQAGGGSFNQKNYKSKTEFAYRMCTGWPTTAMPKPSFLSERAFSRSMVVMWWPVLMWLVAGWDPKFCGWLWDEARWGNVVSCEMSCHVIWCVFIWYDALSCVVWCHVMCSHVMSCHLLWSDAVQWDEIFWVCDAMWLVAMSRYVVRSGCVGWIGRWSGDPYYTVLSTTKYYSNNTLYYKVLLRTTKYYIVLHLYYKVLLQYYSVLQGTTPVPLLVLQSIYLQGAEYQRHQPHHMLRLPRKVTLMIDPRHIWNVIYNARSNRTPPPTSPNTARATQNDSHERCPSHMQRHLQCAEQQVWYTKITKCCACHEKWLASFILVTYEMSFAMRLQPHQMLCLPRQMTRMIDPRDIWSIINNARSIRHHPPPSMIFVTYETSLTMCGATGITLQPHQMLHLPRKMTLMSDVRHIWNVIYNARSNRCHTPRSPNAAPATKNDSHHWSSWHMKCHLQCAEQWASPSNLTKCCACPVEWHAWLILVTYESSFTMRGATGITLQPHQILCLPRKIAFQNLREIARKQLKPHLHWRTISRMIRPWSEPDPSMKLQNWTRPFAELTFPPSATHFVLKITTFRAPAIYPDFTKYCACHEKALSWLILPTWNIIYNAQSNRTPPPTSPSTVPATQNDSHEWCPSHMKRHLQCLPRKMTLMSDVRHIWNVIYNARSNGHHPPTSPNVAPGNDTHDWSS